jgi:hypothetical protein
MFFGLRFEIVLEGSNRFKKGIGPKSASSRPGATTTSEVHNFAFSVGAISAESPCIAAAFEVNSESHTGARPSVRLCVGLIVCRNFDEHIQGGMLSHRGWNRSKQEQPFRYQVRALSSFTLGSK